MLREQAAELEIIIQKAVNAKRWAVVVVTLDDAGALGGDVCTMNMPHDEGLHAAIARGVFNSLEEREDIVLPSFGSN